MGNWIKSIINYTVFVGVPIICIGASSAFAYSMGHDQGKEEGLNTAEALLRSQIAKNEEETKEE